MRRKFSVGLLEQSALLRAEPLALGHHVLLELLLVVADRALEDLDLVVLDLPNLLGHLLNEAKIVAHEHEAALVLADRVGERVDLCER